MTTTKASKVITDYFNSMCDGEHFARQMQDMGNYELGVDWERLKKTKCTVDDSESSLNSNNEK